MMDRVHAGNIYKVGTLVYAKKDLALKLIIESYYQRIYYCSAVDTPTKQQFAYFERELVPVL